MTVGVWPKVAQVTCWSAGWWSADRRRLCVVCKPFRDLDVYWVVGSSQSQVPAEVIHRGARERVSVSQVEV
ncbi:unnamed protein product, partial [Staurois parvus]